jgi:hypothetical protein
MDFEKHLEYNTYKDKLNEIFDKLDEVIYISNTIDYKKINILLSEIVQNFDYYKTDVIPSPNVEKVVEKAMGGKRGRRKVKGGVGDDIPDETIVGTPVEGTPVEGTPLTPLDKQQQPTQEPPPPQPPLPYSDIDDQSMTIKHITEGYEYKNLVSYIQDTNTRIDDKGGKLKTRVDDFIKAHLLTLETTGNLMIRDDFLKQYSSLVFKLEDIIKNIEKIRDGIHNEGTADAKINVDLMTNQWHLFSWGKTHFFTTDFLYWFKKRFSKDAHVINAEKLTKERYNEFREKLYNLYVKLHEDFPQSPEETKYETGILELVFTEIKIKLEERYNELKAKAKEEAVAVAEAEEAKEEKAEAAKEEAAKEEAVAEAEEAKEEKAEEAAKAKEEKAEAAKAKEEKAEAEAVAEAKAEAEAKEAKERAYKEVKPEETTNDTNVNVKSATPQPSTTTPEEDITKKALQKIKEGNEARTKATADALDAKAKLMNIEAEAKSTKDALAKQKAELEEQARASVLAERDKASSTLKGLIGSTPQITKAKGAFSNLGKDVMKVGLSKTKIPTNPLQLAQ